MFYSNNSNSNSHGSVHGAVIMAPSSFDECSMSASQHLDQVDQLEPQVSLYWQP